MPALSIRWDYERGWFIAEGLLVQGLFHTKFFPEGTEPEAGSAAGESVVPSIADGTMSVSAGSASQSAARRST
jgi:hypothetical protein